MFSTKTISMFYRHHSKANSVSGTGIVRLPLILTPIKLLALTGCLALASCTDNGQTTAIDGSIAAKNDAIATKSPEASASDSSNKNASNEDAKAAAQDANTDSSNTTANNANITNAMPETIPETKAIKYDVADWSTKDIESFTMDDLEQMQTIFGKVTTTDENSLDYASNTAIKYRFMEGDKPYLDIIDSQDYLEFGWYYANPNDSDKEKELSLSHAKKVYKVAQGLMGEEGKQLVGTMLSGQITKDKAVGAQQVALAKCEFYSCMLILQKSDS